MKELITKSIPSYILWGRRLQERPKKIFLLEARGSGGDYKRSQGPGATAAQLLYL
jgi:hypothetical protein